MRFVRGDAEALPLEDASVDGALCECALCTFPDKPAAAELARVLRPGARLALSDLTAEDPARLPPSLVSLQAWVACIADARPLAEIAALLEHAAFVVEQAETDNGALEQLLDRIEARLHVASMLAFAAVEGARALLGDARRALEADALGYGVVIAHRA